jgi:redox-sensitive bicupin YhaK (pirin superfamily)
MKTNTMATRSIEVVVPPREPHFVGDGFRVHNFIPSGYRLDMQRMDPFIMLDYNSKFHFPPSRHPKGVGVHPHRGFETVTIAYKGKVAHHDSGGGGGVIGEGDVQWMTAASGVLHKEYHEEEFSRMGGDFQMVQLWVNLPSKDKMSQPKYQSITNGQMAKVPLADNAGTVEVIAGDYNGQKGPASTFTPVHLYNARVKAGGKAEFSFPEHYNTSLLVVEGSIKVNGAEEVPTDHFVLFENDGEVFSVEALEDALVLVLSGEPINEPIAAQGPFVMNTRAELAQAYQDYNLGKFGYLD